LGTKVLLFGNEGFTVDDPQNAIDSNISTKWQGVTGNIFPLTATAESSGSEYPPSHTIDGNQSTYWWGYGENPWIKFDLGEIRQVSGFRETSGSFPGNPFTAYVSTDDVSYDLVASGSLTQFSYSQHSFTTRDVRYIKLYVQRTDATGFGELVEFNALVNDAWIKFDLGEIRQVNGFRETSGNWPANPYDLYVSSDDVLYTEISLGSLTQYVLGEHLFITPMDVRYFKLFLQRTDSTGYGELAEFDALGESANTSPTANAWDNLSISSEDQGITVIQGTATDPDNDTLTFKWLEGMTELSTGNVGTNGEAYLDLGTVSYFSIGEHTLTLEVSDGQAISTDDMILTVDNSAPHAAPIGGGTYEIFSDVIVRGDVSDFDGDLLSYVWREGSDILASDFQNTVQGGNPVKLPDHTFTDFTLGLHTITLSVDDGINEPITSNITVNIVDTTVPTLAPVPNKTILWPPNHKMVDIMIEANTSDNSGGQITLSATVSSNEPQDSLEDGDTSPDWTEPVIDQENCIIYLQLRSERSGSGDGRIYTITITATDEIGNSSQSHVEIMVPHDKGKKK
jgi:hypothetical protein